MDALRAGVTLVAFVPLFALDTLCAGVTLVALFTLDTLCAGVTFIALVTLFTLDALRTGVALVAFVTFYAEGGDAGIGIADPPVAVCADKGRETVYTVFTVCAVLTIFTIFAILAVRTGSAPAAARADQRCKPFLLRADKAVLHRDVVGGKPDDIAR